MIHLRGRINNPKQLKITKEEGKETDKDHFQISGLIKCIDTGAIF